MSSRHVTKGASVLLCDTHAEGFPVMYASRGFLKASGRSAADCVGKPHSQVLGGMAVGSSDLLQELGRHGGAAGMPHDEVEAALACLSSAADAEYEAMASDRTRAGYYVTLGRDGAGNISVSEVLLFFPKHSTTGWTYGFGLQRDVTRGIPVDSLLLAASSGGYAGLVEDRAKAAKEGALPWYSAGDPTVKYFETKAILGWREMLGRGGAEAAPPKQDAGGSAGAPTGSTRAPDGQDSPPDASAPDVSDSSLSPPSPSSPGARAHPAEATGRRGSGKAPGRSAQPGGTPTPAAAPPARGAAYEELYIELARVAGVLNREAFERDHVAAIDASAAGPAESPRGPDEEQATDTRHGAEPGRDDPSTEPGDGAGRGGLREEPDDAGIDELYEELAGTAGALSAELFMREHRPSLACVPHFQRVGRPAAIP